MISLFVKTPDVLLFFSSVVTSTWPGYADEAAGHRPLADYAAAASLAVAPSSKRHWPLAKAALGEASADADRLSGVAPAKARSSKSCSPRVLAPVQNDSISAGQNVSTSDHARRTASALSKTHPPILSKTDPAILT
jgi:hypothetical protein